MELLDGAVRPYAWGSRTVIAELRGHQVPAPHPEAELWLGAHPANPATVGGRPLTELLAADPDGQLGATADRWSGRLPFLLKVLAADEPLSLQAHPSSRLAEEGYAREEDAGIPRDAPNRNYPDPTAKPELLCALSEFHALAGFRDPATSAALLRALECPPLDPYTELLAAQPDEHGLRALLTTLVTLPSAALADLVPAVLDACVAHVRARGPFDAECRTVLELGESYPGDAGVLAALLLNHLVLAPGEAVYIRAGDLHTYLRGTAVEILANSDNVLRCGLTTKHVDVPELLRVLDFTSAGPMRVLTGEPSCPHARVYRTAVAEFELTAVDFAGGGPAEVRFPAPGPKVLLCVAGAAQVRTATDKRELRRGAAVWLPACDGEVTVAPLGAEQTKLFLATVGEAQADVG